MAIRCKLCNKRIYEDYEMDMHYTATGHNLFYDTETMEVIKK